MYHWVPSKILHQFDGVHMDVEKVDSMVSKAKFKEDEFTVAPEEGLFYVQELTMGPLILPDVPPSTSDPSSLSPSFLSANIGPELPSALLADQPPSSSIAPASTPQSPKPTLPVHPYHRMPRMAVIRIPGMVTGAAAEDILDSHKRMEEAGLSKAEFDTRSKQAKSHHFGRWSKYTKMPFTTSATVKQNTKTKIAMDDFLHALDEHIAKPGLAFMEAFDPHYVKTTQR